MCLLVDTALLLHRVGKGTISVAEAESMILAEDADQNGTVDFEEFIRFSGAKGTPQIKATADVNTLR